MFAVIHTAEGGKKGEKLFHMILEPVHLQWILSALLLSIILHLYTSPSTPSECLFPDESEQKDRIKITRSDTTDL